MDVPHRSAIAPLLLLPFLGSCASNAPEPEEPGAATGTTEPHAEDGSPSIEAATDVFVRPLEVRISAGSPELVVRFTVDGSEPDDTSTRYVEPILLGGSTLLRARSFRDDVAVGAVTQRMFRRAEPHAGLHAVGPVLGLRLESFAAEEPTDVEGLEPLAVAPAYSVELPAGGPTEGVIHRFTGYVTVSADGLYVVELDADDAARVSVSGEVLEVAGHPGSGTLHVALGRGAHPLVVEHFNGSGERSLELRLGMVPGPATPIATQRLTRDGIER